MAKKKISDVCAWCGREGSVAQGRYLVPSPLEESVMICTECAETIHEMMAEQQKKQPKASAGNFARQMSGKVPTPAEIKESLARSLTRQDVAKQYLSVAVYNHYKRLLQPETADELDI